jgi:hypothetical protein
LEPLCIAVRISIRKNAMSFLLLLISLFNRTGEKCRTGSAWKGGGRQGEGGGRAGGEMTQTMYAHVNK